MQATTEHLKSLLAWIDSVPQDAVLPAMPGFDRDPVDELAKGKGDANEADLVEAIEMASDWIACVPQAIKDQLAPVPVA